MKLLRPFVALFVLVTVSLDRLVLRAAADTKPLTLDALLAWKNIESAFVTTDGAWLGYRLSPNQGDDEIVLRHTQTERELRFSAGEVPLPPEMMALEGPPPPPHPALSFRTMRSGPRTPSTRQLASRGKRAAPAAFLRRMASGW